jgi:hypothetical protein
MRAHRPQLVEELCRLVVKLNRRTASGRSPHFDIPPGHATIPARADRFHGGFFGGEASGVALCLVRLGLAITDFVGRENALQEAPPEAFDGPRDAVHLRNIDTGSDDHKKKAAFRQRTVSSYPTSVPHVLSYSKYGGFVDITARAYRNCLGFHSSTAMIGLLD